MSASLSEMSAESRLSVILILILILILIIILTLAGLWLLDGANQLNNPGAEYDSLNVDFFTGSLPMDCVHYV